MTRIALDLTPLILSAVCVAENEGNPMSASDLAFMLDLPQSAIDLGLSQLVSKGSISKDGDLFRYDLRRELTASELAEIEDLHHQFEEMRPLIDQAPARLDN